MPSYATLADMVSRFGQTEMIRLSATGDDLPAQPDGVRVQVALDDVTSVIDSYLRNRYLVPLNPVPREITRAACILARFDLSQGHGKVPSEEVTKERDAILKWLQQLADTEGKLDAPPAEAASDAQFQDRDRAFSTEPGDWLTQGNEP